MKAIKYEIKEVAWPYAFLFNTHPTLGGFKSELKDIFEDYDLIGVDAFDKESIQASKQIYKDIVLDFAKLYALQKTLPYRLSVVLTTDFCNCFIQDDRHTTGKIVYEIRPCFPYELNWTDRENANLCFTDAVYFIDTFGERYPERNPYQVTINKESLCDYLVKYVRIFNKQFNRDEGSRERERIARDFISNIDMI